MWAALRQAGPNAQLRQTKARERGWNARRTAARCMEIGCELGDVERRAYALPKAREGRGEGMGARGASASLAGMADKRPAKHAIADHGQSSRDRLLGGVLARSRPERRIPPAASAQWTL